ncbi:acyl-CoA thioesterase [Gordonia sp. (in: high G+C Gram-positive bacteria)]|uniref:acyl-CoA thioesterase n=1 Tax=Gordonia sp. (in: high G+C Gram-positive bacteria) TaxID=84139 RepID=UPI003C7235FD
MSETPYVVEIQLRWGDMDPLNHINNVHYARIVEEARVRAMRDWFTAADREFSMLIARQEIEFVTPLLYSPDSALVEIWVSRMGTKSFDFGYRIKSAEGETCALAETTCAVVDPATGQPVVIAEAARRYLENQMGPEVEFRRRR